MLALGRTTCLIAATLLLGFENKNIPYIVLEGHVDAEMYHYHHSEFSKKVKKVLYAGSLRKIYGIKNLCEAFTKIYKPNEELHIYGDGDYVPELIELIKLNNQNIFFHGNCMNDEVIQAELDATLLVNPRPTEGEYTKFSFPSKTLEYMVSGTPVLTAKLQGIPKEYEKYLYYFDDEDEDDLAFSLRKLLDSDLNIIKLKGQQAREYVLREKNNVVQAKNIIKLIEKLRRRKDI